MVIASWNVQALSDIKLWELSQTMLRHSIGIMCVQETRRLHSPYYLTDNGFLVILLGSSNATHEFGGVGCIVAPWVVHAVGGFLQQSNRLACLKIRVPKSKLHGYRPTLRILAIP